MDQLYETAFGLILAAGNSKSNSMMAIAAAREFRFEDAAQYIENAKDEMVAAHQIQTDLIHGEAQGTKCDLNIIMVHAQDHLSMALMTLDNASEMLKLYQTIDELNKRINRLFID